MSQLIEYRLFEEQTMSRVVSANGKSTYSMSPRGTLPAVTCSLSPWLIVQSVVCSLSISVPNNKVAALFTKLQTI